MKTELTRFKVKEGMSYLVDEWISFLNDNMSDVLLTFVNEKMYVETIFREVLEGREYLYWYSIQGEGGSSVESSTHWIDEKHMEYWRQCIDMTVPGVDLSPQVVMIAPSVQEVIHS